MSVITWSLDNDTAGTTAYVNAKFLTATYTGPVIRRMARHRFLGSPWRSPDGVRADKLALTASVSQETRMYPPTTGSVFSRCTGVVPVAGGGFALTHDRFTLRTANDILNCLSTHEVFPAALGCDSVPSFIQSFYHPDIQPLALSTSLGSPIWLSGSLPSTLPIDWRPLRIQQPTAKYASDDFSSPNTYNTPCQGRLLRATPNGFATPAAFDANDNAVLTPIEITPSATDRIPIFGLSLDIVVGIASAFASAPTIRVRAYSNQRFVDIATLDITPSVSGGYVGYYAAHTLSLSPAQRDISVGLTYSVISGSLGISPSVAIEAKVAPILPGYARQMLTSSGFKIIPGAAKRTGTLRTV